jgi:hypothetical protein
MSFQSIYQAYMSPKSVLSLISVLRWYQKTYQLFISYFWFKFKVLKLGLRFKIMVLGLALRFYIQIDVEV